MNRKSRTFALLAAVGNYHDGTEFCDLDSSKNDLEIMTEALTRGLKIDTDNIRKLGTDGTVTTMSFARSIAEFDSMLSEEDTFIFYFSGHGQNRELIFSDGGIIIKSIVDYVEKLPAKQIIVILDCCYSGQAMVGPMKTISYEESVSEFAGTGIAVLASCSADSKARLEDGGNCSLYTQIVYYALTFRRKIREGKISLTDISDEIRFLMEQWNRSHPGKEQKPIFRENMIGTIYFPVEEYHPYMPQKVFFETEEYIVHHVKPLSTGTQKRLAVFVILKTDDDSIIPEITKKIVPQVLYTDVYSSKRSEMRFHGRPADVVWCYFGHDEADLIRSNHFAYTIWSGEEKLRETYYRENRNAETVDDIYVFWNSSYEMVKEMQESERSGEEIIAEYRKLGNLLIMHAESFVKDLEEAENGTISFLTVKAANREWVHEVKQLFFKLTDADVAPIEVNDWTEKVLNLAGWVVDMAIILEVMNDGEEARTQWMMKNTVERYREAVEKA